MVCWLQPKRAMFDLGLRRGGGRPPRRWRREASLRLLRPHGGQNAHKWPSETPPHPPPHCQPVLMEGSGRVPQQWSRGPGGTSQRPREQPCPECDTVASAHSPLIAQRERERGLLGISPNARASVAKARHRLAQRVCFYWESVFICRDIFI